ncbi:putative hyaluronan/mRNA-binding protein [Helianthus annuus]|nr:putative hyaluronan/mRNA-binding protein [Helianthus annuus]KAJ0750236.1 putative hyaluronan/mRNA-binding protein [Helianthus annuus]
MATMNPFDLLVDDDNDDPNQLIAKLPVAVTPAAKKTPPAKPAAKLPSKPLPPAQVVQEAKTNGQRGSGQFGGRGGRGGRGFNRDSAADNENFYGTNNGSYRPSEDGDVEKTSERRAGYGGPRGGYRGGRRGGYTNGDAADGERPRRVFERHIGTGRGNGFKREGAGRGNWGTATDEIAVEPEEAMTEVEKNVEESAGQEDGVDANKENPATEVGEKEPEEKEMTLEEYEKVLEEKRKALQALKSEERKVALDKDLAKMQLLSNKKK